MAGLRLTQLWAVLTRSLGRSLAVYALLLQVLLPLPVMAATDGNAPAVLCTINPSQAVLDGKTVPLAAHDCLMCCAQAAAGVEPPVFGTATPVDYHLAFALLGPMTDRAPTMVRGAPPTTRGPPQI